LQRLWLRLRIEREARRRLAEEINRRAPHDALYLAQSRRLRADHHGKA
jgi:hypothetical protein